MRREGAAGPAAATISVAAGATRTVSAPAAWRGGPAALWIWRFLGRGGAAYRMIGLQLISAVGIDTGPRAPMQQQPAQLQGGRGVVQRGKEAPPHIVQR